MTNPQKIQDRILSQKTAAEKIKISSDLTMLCLKLNKLNEQRHPTRTTDQSRSGS